MLRKQTFNKYYDAAVKKNTALMMGIEDRIVAGGGRPAKIPKSFHNVVICGLQSSAILGRNLTPPEASQAVQKALAYLSGVDRTVQILDDEGVPRITTTDIRRLIKEHRGALSLRVAHERKDRKLPNVANVTEFLRFWQYLLHHLGIPPENIWNADETGVIADGRGSGGKLVVITLPSSHSHAPAVRKASGDRASFTIVMVSSAGGSRIPMFSVLRTPGSKPRNSFRPEWLRDVPGDAAFVSNSSGYMDPSSWTSFLNHFISHTRAKINPFYPTILLVDNHYSRFDSASLAMALRAGLAIVCLPPNATAILQPCDLSCNARLKKEYKDAITKLQGSNLTLGQALGLIAECYDTATAPAVSKQGWRHAGLVPFEPQHVFLQLGIERGSSQQQLCERVEQILGECALHSPRRKRSAIPWEENRGMVQAMVLGLQQLEEERYVAEEEDKHRRGPNRQNWRTVLGHVASKLSVIGVCVERERDILAKLAKESARRLPQETGESEESKDETLGPEDGLVSYEGLCRRSSVDAVFCFLHVHKQLGTWRERDTSSVRRHVDGGGMTEVEEATLDEIRRRLSSASDHERLGEIGYNTHLIEELTREACKDASASSDIAAIDRLMCSALVKGNPLVKQREQELTEVMKVVARTMSPSTNSRRRRQRQSNSRAPKRRASNSSRDNPSVRRRIER